MEDFYEIVGHETKGFSKLTTTQLEIRQSNLDLESIITSKIQSPDGMIGLDVHLVKHSQALRNGLVAALLPEQNDLTDQEKSNLAAMLLVNDDERRVNFLRGLVGDDQADLFQQSYADVQTEADRLFQALNSNEIGDLTLTELIDGLMLSHNNGMAIKVQSLFDKKRLESNNQPNNTTIGELKIKYDNTDKLQFLGLATAAAFIAGLALKFLDRPYKKRHKG